MNFKKIPFLLCIICVFAWLGCTKEEENKLQTTPTGLAITLVEFDTVQLQATISGAISTDGGSPILAKGICYSKRNINPTIEDDIITATGTEIAAFSVNVTGLENSTHYFARAFATNALGTSYGTVREFDSRSLPPKPIVIVSTTVVSKVTIDSAVTGGIITDSAGSFISDRGIVFSSNPGPSTTNGATIVRPKLKKPIFTLSMKNLVEGGTYFYRAYATTSLGIAYGPELSFKTQIKSTPLLTTNPLTSITITSVTSGGSIFNALSDSLKAESILRIGLLYSKYEPGSSTNVDTIFSDVPAVSVFPIRFTKTINELEPNTIYYVWAFAITKKAKKFGFGQVFSFTTLRSEITFNGDVYKTTLIGSQLWMKENLKTTKFSDGSDIPVVNDASSWKTANSQKQGATTLYNETDAEYGKLYNYYSVVDARQLCPVGWHIPSDADWTTFYANTGGVSAFLKDTQGWVSNGQNSSGFSAKPNGYRKADGAFAEKGGKAFYWGSSTSGLKADAIEITDKEAVIKRNYYDKNSGFSVRCLRD